MISPKERGHALGAEARERGGAGFLALLGARDRGGQTRKVRRQALSHSLPGTRGRVWEGVGREVAGGAVDDEIATAVAAHDRERGGSRMRAALAAAREVHRQRSVEHRGGGSADQ